MKLTASQIQRNEHPLQYSDSDLVKAACAGNIDSFRALYERYYEMAVGIARSRLSDRHLAEDAAQEAFAIACRRLASLRDTTRFAQWLGTICRRTARKMARFETNGSAGAQEPVSVSSDEDRTTVTRVHQAMAQLSTSAREVIQLHYFSGLSYDEIARVLGISRQAVHGRMQRARRMLANYLNEIE